MLCRKRIIISSNYKISVRKRRTAFLSSSMDLSVWQCISHCRALQGSYSKVIPGEVSIYVPMCICLNVCVCVLCMHVCVDMSLWLPWLLQVDEMDMHQLERKCPVLYGKCQLLFGSVPMSLITMKTQTHVHTHTRHANTSHANTPHANTHAHIHRLSNHI